MYVEIFSVFIKFFICLFDFLESTHEFGVDHTCDHNMNNDTRLTLDWSSPDITTGMISFIFA